MTSFDDLKIDLHPRQILEALVKEKDRKIVNHQIIRNDCLFHLLMIEAKEHHPVFYFFSQTGTRIKIRRCKMCHFSDSIMESMNSQCSDELIKHIEKEHPNENRCLIRARQRIKKNQIKEIVSSIEQSSLKLSMLCGNIMSTNVQAYLEDIKQQCIKIEKVFQDEN